MLTLCLRVAESWVSSGEGGSVHLSLFLPYSLSFKFCAVDTAVLPKCRFSNLSSSTVIGLNFSSSCCVPFCLVTEVLLCIHTVFKARLLVWKLGLCLLPFFVPLPYLLYILDSQ